MKFTTEECIIMLDINNSFTEMDMTHSLLTAFTRFRHNGDFQALYAKCKAYNDLKHILHLNPFTHRILRKNKLGEMNTKHTIPVKKECTKCIRVYLGRGVSVPSGRSVRTCTKCKGTGRVVVYNPKWEISTITPCPKCSMQGKTGKVCKTCGGLTEVVRKATYFTS